MELVAFSPVTGVTMTTLLLELTDDVSGCAKDGRCQVTVGGRPAEVIGDDGALLVSTPRGVESDLVCATVDGHETCMGGFELLARPEVDEVTVVRGRCANSIVVAGEGFPSDARVTLDGLELGVFVVSSTQLVAQLPVEATAGDQALVVFAPSHGRCGTPTDPVTVTVP